MESANARGLIKCVSDCLSPLGITDVSEQLLTNDVTEGPVLVGGGTDGANVNVGDLNGIKGLVQSKTHGFCGLGAMHID